jgi:enamine deaminase RidA (YjgF/YER057c/UK114 family)
MDMQPDQLAQILDALKSIDETIHAVGLAMVMMISITAVALYFK